MLQKWIAALRRECLWSRPIKGAMGSFVIVLLEPVGDDATGLLHGGKQPAIETPIAQDPVQALVMPVLPRAARINKMRLNMTRMQPQRDPLRDELRTIITFHRDWSPSLGEYPLQHVPHIPRCH